MTEKDSSVKTLTEKISQLQKTLTASEHDRRILQVILLSTVQAFFRNFLLRLFLNIAAFFR